MHRIIAVSVGLGLTFASAGHAQSPDASPVVIELFTSQGCSSCPPADELLGRMTRREDVIPLALHVDYWDYIGWTDTFGNVAFSDRQRAYAQAAGVRTVYTPQMIVGGMDHLVGVHPEDLEAVIARQAVQPAPVVLELRRDGASVRVVARARAEVPQGSAVQLVRYRPHEQVEIRLGENAGRTIDYANIVTEWKQVAEWDGQGELSLTLDAPGSDSVAVIVQEPGPGPILAARTLPQP